MEKSRNNKCYYNNVLNKVHVVVSFAAVADGGCCFFPSSFIRIGINKLANVLVCFFITLRFCNFHFFLYAVAHIWIACWKSGGFDVCFLVSQMCVGVHVSLRVSIGFGASCCAYIMIRVICSCTLQPDNYSSKV